MLDYCKQRWKGFVAGIIGGALIPYFTCPRCFDSVYLYAIVSGFTITTWLTMWLGMELLTDSLDRKIQWTKHPMKRLLVGLVATTAYAMIVAVALKFMFELITGIRMGNVAGVLIYNLGITLLITFFLTSRSFLFNWRQTSIDAERLMKESIAAQYESLKNQVNPHFLFNSFNVLSNLVYDDPDKAVKFIKQLSDVYRYVLDSRTKELVSLEDELHFLRSYVFLQQIRFGEKLRITIELNGTPSQVAPLALQMLVENAIKHNVVSQDDPLSIEIFHEGDYIVVRNNLQKKIGQSEPSSGLGLHNICRRYEFLTDRKVVIDEGNDTFTVKLPLIAN